MLLGKRSEGERLQRLLDPMEKSTSSRSGRFGSCWLRTWWINFPYSSVRVEAVLIAPA